MKLSYYILICLHILRLSSNEVKLLYINMFAYFKVK